MTSANLYSRLYPYQRRWLEDQATCRIWVSSRQVGKSTAVALEALLAALAQPGSTQILVSAGQAQAQELLRKARQWGALLDGMLDWRGRVVGEGNKSTLPVSVGGQESRVISLPNNPATVAGYGGHIWFDEAGRTPRMDELFAAAAPIATRAGYRISMVGTPLGDVGLFARIWQDAGGQYSDWSRHRVTVHEAVDQGAAIDLAKTRRLCPDSWVYAQEYLCEFHSDATSYLPLALLESATLQHDQRPAPTATDEVFVGVDVGRYQDLTAIVTLRRPSGSDLLWCQDVQTLRGESFDVQEAEIKSALRTAMQAGSRVVCRVDATGLGMQLAERLSQRYPDVVEGVTFTAQSKERMAGAVRVALEERRLRLPYDTDLLTDCHAIRRGVTRAGTVVLSVQYSQSERQERGHADRFWALALACLGAAEERQVGLSWLDLIEAGAGKTSGTWSLGTDIGRLPGFGAAGDADSAF